MIVAAYGAFATSYVDRDTLAVVLRVTLHGHARTTPKRPKEESDDQS